MKLTLNIDTQKKENMNNELMFNRNILITEVVYFLGRIMSSLVQFI